MKSTVSVYIRCPYYVREERGQAIKVVCEGIVDATSLHTYFDRVKALKEHRAKYCMGRYNRCPIAEALNRKYCYDSGGVV